MKSKIIIGTRKSRLALWQAKFVKDELQKHLSGVRVVLKEIKTKGDNITDVALSKIGDKGLFTKEIEDALLKDEIDIAVHSLKDLPTKLPDGLIIGAVTKREKPHDVLLSNRQLKFAEFSKGAKIGTTSLRRVAQLKAIRDDYDYLDLRGNLETRVNKMQAGQYDGIILAYAGVKRLKLDFLVREEFNPKFILPAVGQGALAIEIKDGNKEILDMVEILNDRNTSLISTLERSFLKVLGGGCQAPIGAYSEVEEGKITAYGMVASLDGKRIIRDNIQGEANPESCKDLGEKLAHKLLQNNGDKILQEIMYLKRSNMQFEV